MQDAEPEEVPLPCQLPEHRRWGAPGWWAGGGTEQRTDRDGREKGREFPRHS